MILSLFLPQVKFSAFSPIGVLARTYLQPPWIRRLQRLKANKRRISVPVIPETEKLNPDPRLSAVNPVVYRSKRTGVIAYKVGSTSLWDEWGERHYITVCKLHQAVVSKTCTISSDGYEAVQVGIGKVNIKKVKKHDLGNFIKVGISPKEHKAEFRVTSECLLPEGLNLSVRHFVPGQWVFVSGWTKPKGFQGVVKRWHFSGMPESHGTIKGSRQCGSVSSGKTVGLVFKGKRMAGHMGPDPRVTNCKVFRTESHRQLIFLIGCVPGAVGDIVKISDGRGRTRRKNRHINLPYPTFVPKPGVEYPVTVTQPPLGRDPFTFPDRAIYDLRGK